MLQLVQNALSGWGIFQGNAKGNKNVFNPAEGIAPASIREIAWEALQALDSKVQPM